MSEHPTLKSCPFCKGDWLKANMQQIGLMVEEHWIHCLNCTASGPIASEVESAAILWNMREEAKP